MSKDGYMSNPTTPPDEQEQPQEEDVFKNRYSVPKFTSWSGKSIYDYDELIGDYSSFEELDEALTKARKALFVINDRLSQAERKAVGSRKTYERQYRREYLASTEKTQESKHMRAALKCEELENECLMYEQVKKELERLAFVMKSEVQTLNTMAHNLRAQIKTF